VHADIVVVACDGLDVRSSNGPSGVSPYAWKLEKRDVPLEGLLDARAMSLSSPVYSKVLLVQYMQSRRVGAAGGADALYLYLFTSEDPVVSDAAALGAISSLRQLRGVRASE